MRDENSESNNKADPLARKEPLPPIPSSKDQSQQQQQQQGEHGQIAEGDGQQQPQQEDDTAGSPREEDFEFAAMLKDMQVRLLSFILHAGLDDCIHPVVLLPVLDCR